jgi:predicted nucleotidyltransferase component of viral defense system
VLQKQAISNSTFNVLKKLGGLDFLNDFNLVGGTALALYWGHRISDDIDLFTDKKKELLFLEGELNKIPGAKFQKRTDISIVYFVDDIKTDLLIYPYPFQQRPHREENIQIAALDDIVTMKLGAITNRGAKKDFIDLYYILQHYSLEKLCNLYIEKYRTNDLFALFRSITFFDDAEPQEMPEMLIDKHLTWNAVKNEIQKKVKAYIG